MSQLKSITTKIFMSQQTAQPAIRIREEKYFMTKDNSVAIENVKKPKKFHRDIENSVIIK